MRIVFLRSNPIDPDSRVEKEVSALIKGGHQVQALGWDRSADYKMRKQQKVVNGCTFDIWRVGIKSGYGGGVKQNLIPLVKFQIAIFRWLIGHRNEYDAIHACDFDTAFTGFFCKERLKKKFVYDIFDYYVDSFQVPGRLKKVIEKSDHKIIKNADAVILCTEQRKEQIQVSPRKTFIIHNSPYQIKSNESKSECQDERMKIVYVGIFGEQRMIPELLEIVANHKEEMVLNIAGFGKLEEIVKEYAKKYSNIFYFGRIEYGRTLELERESDIMTALYAPDNRNHYYAAPNKFYEALMLGKPVIMVKNTGMSDVVAENAFGKVIDYQKKSLETALLELFQERGGWGHIAIQEREFYQKKYNWDEMQKRLLKLYQTI